MNQAKEQSIHFKITTNQFQLEIVSPIQIILLALGFLGFVNELKR
jgi:hypothetical protein